MKRLNRHWTDVETNPSSTQNGVKDRRETDDKSSSLYLRHLWSSSPLPPHKQDAEQSLREKSSRGADRKNSSDDGSSHASSSGSSGSYSSESYRRSRRRKRSSRSRRHTKKRGRSLKSRRRRSYSSSSSSSGSSSSESSCSSSSTSSHKSERRHNKKVKPDEDEDAKTEEAVPETVLESTGLREAQEFKKAVQGSMEEEEEEGPMPLQVSAVTGGGADGNASYGKALLPGEGQALAQYVQQNLRIPRRGEIGYSGDDIELWENSGYVMSGSRHTRMNAVRIRKENQVYSAEEQRALALLTMEENQQKEAQLMEDFRTMLKEKKKMRDKGK